jgi:hypothetical protein
VLVPLEQVEGQPAAVDDDAAEAGFALWRRS